MSRKKSSSFENGENYADAWKKYLAENADEEVELDEGFLDNLKTAFKAGSQAYKGAKVAGRKAGRDLTRATGGEVSSITQNLAGRKAGQGTLGKAMDKAKDTEPETPEAPPSPEAAASAASAPVQLFTGDKALYSKLFSTIMARFNNKEIAGTPVKLDKTQVQNTVKQILKDLSAQLRASGMQVQEAHIPELVELVFEEIEKSQILEAAYTGAQTAGQGTPKNAAEKWIAAGKPELTTVNGNNLVTRDADHYANAKRGILKPAALAYAKAQVAWLQKNKPDQSIPSMLSNAIQATAASPQAKHYGGDKTATGSRVAPKQGQVDAGRAVGGKIVALVGQAAGADVKDREMRKMVTSDIQQDLKAIIMKVVKPHLQQHLRGTDINLREEKEVIDEEK